eukprot:m51a1_g14296 hypothetical protein (594) ;mRNA; r:428386-430568
MRLVQAVPLCVLALLAAARGQPFAVTAPLSVWVAGAKGSPLVSAGAAVAAPALRLSALNQTVRLAWSSQGADAVHYSLTSTFSVTSAATSVALDPPQGPVALVGVQRAGTVPQSDTEWSLVVNCTAGYQGTYQLEILAWNERTSQVYAPATLQVQVTCSKPGCDASCTRYGHGKCTHLLGTCTCADNFEGTGCTYQISPFRRSVCPGEPLEMDFRIPDRLTTGQEWYDLWCEGCIFSTSADWRYIWPWSQHVDTRIAPPKIPLNVTRTLPTLLSPGVVYVTVYRSTFERSLGYSTYNVLSWEQCGRNSSCSSSAACNGGACVQGACSCPHSLWGPRCERGCVPNVTEVHTDRRGAIQSDRGAADRRHSFYTQDTQCSWVITPSGRRGSDWDYIHVSFDWLDIGDGDSLTVLRGADPATAVLDSSFTAAAQPQSWKIYSSSALIQFISDFNNGGNGFRLTYEVRKNPDHTLAIALPVGIGGFFILCGFAALSAYGCIYCRKRGRRDPKPLNLPVEAPIPPMSIAASFANVTPYEDAVAMASAVAAAAGNQSRSGSSSDGPQMQMVITPPQYSVDGSTSVNYDPTYMHSTSTHHS